MPDRAPGTTPIGEPSELALEVNAYLSSKRKRLTPASERGYRSTLDLFVGQFAGRALADFQPPAGTTLIETWLDATWGDKAPSCPPARMHVWNTPLDTALAAAENARPLHSATSTAGAGSKGSRCVTSPATTAQGVPSPNVSGGRSRRPIHAGSGPAHATKTATGACNEARAERGTSRRTGSRINCATGRSTTPSLCATAATTRHASTRSICSSATMPTTWETCGARDAASGTSSRFPLIGDRRCSTITTPVTTSTRRPITSGSASRPSAGTWRAARHTAAQRVLEVTGNLKAAQRLLGHASIQTTSDVYTDWDEQRLAATMRDVLGGDIALDLHRRVRMTGDEVTA